MQCWWNPLRPRQRLTSSQGSITICSANVTSCNTAVSSWLAQQLQTSTQVFAIQETHQSTCETRKLERKLRSWGWKGNSRLLRQLDEEALLAGNFGVASRTWGVTTLADFSLHGNGWSGVLLEFAGNRLALFSIYLKTGDALDSPANSQILEALHGCIKTLASGLPWLVIGD